MAPADVTSSIEPVKAGIQAWYMDDSDEDQRLPHHLEPKQYVSHETLSELGVLHWVIDADKYDEDPLLAKIKKERGYTYQDIIDIAPDRLPNYEAKLKTFFEEHIHDDEEIRFVLDGSGYFDVRDLDDRWIRVWTQKGDMIVLPAGIYHRFTLDSNNYIKALRLFVGDPVWTPHNRPQEGKQARKDYLALFKKNARVEVEAH